MWNQVLARLRGLLLPGWGRAGAWLVLSLAAGCAARGLWVFRAEALEAQVRAFLGAGGNSVALLHGADALVVDVKSGDGALRLRREVTLELGRRVRRVLLTHSHRDHAGGLGLFPAVGSVLAHPQTRARLEREAREDEQGWVPYALVEREVRLLLGAEEVQVLHLGRGHTDGDLVALLPGHRLLLAGDLVLDGFEPYVDEASGGDILEYRQTLERLLALEFERVVPGHGAVMSRAQVERWAAYLPALEAAVAGALAKGRSEEQAVREVTLPEHPLAALPLLSSRADNVRKMYRALSRTR